MAQRERAASLANFRGNRDTAKVAQEVFRSEPISLQYVRATLKVIL